MIQPALEAEKAHLAGLLEAIQRCVYFLIRFLDYRRANLGISPLNGYCAVAFAAIARDYPKQAIPAELSQLNSTSAGIYHDLKTAIEVPQKGNG